MRLFITCVAAAALGAATVLALENNTAPNPGANPGAAGNPGAAANPGAGAVATAPAPTGRTLDDVRKAYSPPVRSMSARWSPERPPEAPPLRIVEANVFAITDPQGNVRADLGALAGETKIQLFDAHGYRRLVLSEKDGVASVTLFSADGEIEGLTLRLNNANVADVTLGASPISGSPAAKALAALNLRCDPSAGPTLAMTGPTNTTDKSNQPAVNLSIHRDEGGILELHSAKANTQLQPGALQLSTPNAGPHASLALPNNNFAVFELARGGGHAAKMEISCSDNAADLRLQAGDLGLANLHSAEDGTFVTVKPPGIDGGLFVGARVEHTNLLLLDGKGQPKIDMEVRDGLPFLHLNGKEQGQTLFKAP